MSNKSEQGRPKPNETGVAGEDPTPRNRAQDEAFTVALRRAFLAGLECPPGGAAPAPEH
jgi:hypothetical protein